MAKFLSEEFMTEATEQINSHAGFTGAITGVDLGMQFHVTEVPDGDDVAYHLSVGDGRGTLALGELDEPDVTVTNSYETAAAVTRGELNAQMAFMTGKFKVAGNMAKLMMNQGVINEFANAMSALDVEY